MAWKLVKIHNEQSGQLQREDGKRFDFAAFQELKKVFDTDVATFNGSLYQSSWRGTIAGSGGQLFFYQPFPGFEDIIRGLSFKQIHVGGPLTFDVVVGPTPGATLETIEGYNLDRRRYATGDHWTSANPILRVDSLTNGEVIDKWFSQAPTTGSNVLTAPIEEIGNIGIYDGTVPRGYIITNNDNTARSISFSWVWKEIIPF